MTRAEILQQLTGIFREIFDRDDLVLSNELTADDIPEWDSYNHINIIVAAETRFGIKFQVAEIERLKNVGELVDLIDVKLKR